MSTENKVVTVKETYVEMKRRHEKEMNEFPIMFAFNEDQFIEGCNKLGVRVLKNRKRMNITSTGYGGFVRKEDAKPYLEMLQRFSAETKEAFDDAEFAYGAFLYELGNHEYCITYEIGDTLEALGLTPEEINKSEVLQKALFNARKDYLESCEY